MSPKCHLFYSVDRCLSCIIHFNVTQWALISNNRGVAGFNLRKNCVNALNSVIFVTGYGSNPRPKNEILIRCLVKVASV
jgi:hypothetical protein